VIACKKQNTTLQPTLPISCRGPQTRIYRRNAAYDRCDHDIHCIVHHSLRSSWYCI